jgi:ADP-heptose:LPS heptosyltransferase
MEYLQTKQGMWSDDVKNREFKKVSGYSLWNMGLDKDNVKHVEEIEKLRESPPNIIIAECVHSVKFVQNWFKEQELKKKTKYVMGLGVFQQLQYGSKPEGSIKKGKKLLKATGMKFKNIYRPYIGQDAEDDTILVFRTGGIGDLLFIQPNLRYLKKLYPTCKIQFACGPQYQPMVEHWDCVDEICDLPFTLKKLQKATYHMLFEGVIERCKAAETTNAYNLFSRWLGLDLPDDLLVPVQTAKEDLVVECEAIIKEWGLEKGSYVVMQLRASSPIRTPRHEFWVKIIDELNTRGYPVLLTDNPRQTENVDDFIKLLKNQEMTFNFCEHSKSIDYTIALTSLSKATMGTDSALGHIAASLDIPCFGIYGPFPGHIRLKTYPKASWVDAERHCGPCFIHGHTPCSHASPDGYSPCYDELIQTDDKLKIVIDKFEELIK